MSATDFFGNRRIIKNVLAAFPVRETIDWFHALGVELKREDTGKLFPTTDKARTVLQRAAQLLPGPGHQHVHRPAGEPHRGRSRREEKVHSRSPRGAIHTKTLILATGGRSLPKSGSDGSGYALASDLGHSVTATVPALVPLLLDDKMFHRELSGVSQEVALTTVLAGKAVDVRTGSLLWTHFGVSGPVVMDASRVWTLARERGDQAEIYLNVLPEWTFRAGEALVHHAGVGESARSVVKTLALVVPGTVCRGSVCSAWLRSTAGAAQMPRSERDRLLAVLTRLALPVTGTGDGTHAEVTAEVSRLKKSISGRWSRNWSAVCI